MPDAASNLLELLVSDEVEPLSQPGSPISGEEIAERLENHLERLKRRGDPGMEGLDLLEDAVLHLRAHEAIELAPWTYEDSEGIRWFVLANDDDVIACYTSQPFIEADI